MSRRRTAPVPNQSRRAGLRTQGYADGLAGRVPRMDEPEYRTSYRRGQERRAQIAKEDA